MKSYVTTILWFLHNFKVYNFVTNTICIYLSSTMQCGGWEYVEVYFHSLIRPHGVDTCNFITNEKNKNYNDLGRMVWTRGCKHICMYAHFYWNITCILQHDWVCRRILRLIFACYYVAEKSGKNRPRWSQRTRRLKILEESFNVSD